MKMKACLLACLLLGAWCCGPQVAAARVWSGVDLMHVESEDGRNMCALTFDDGPAGYTPHLLDVLAAEGIPATFFMLGRQVEQHPDLVRRVVAEGHDIGIHSQTHPNMRRLGVDRQAEELVRPLLALQEQGIAARWFRPPYGNMNASLKELAGYLGLSIIIWTHDSQAWKRTRSDYANLETATGAPTPEGAMRGVFLMHDTSARTAAELPEIIRILRARGCQRFVTVSEYLGQAERPMPSGRDEALFVLAGKSLLKVLHTLEQGPHGAGAALLSRVVAAVAAGQPVPSLADAGLQTPCRTLAANTSLPPREDAPAPAAPGIAEAPAMPVPEAEDAASDMQDDAPSSLLEQTPQT